MDTQKSPYLMNTWYIAALSTDVAEGAIFQRRLLDIAVVMYRKSDGTLSALRDRCPHRFAPLSMGRLEDDNIVCPYHGLRFDCSGKCTHNPHGSNRIPAKAAVRSFQTLERFGFIWIWMGDEPADESQLPDYSQLDDGPDTGVGHTYMSRPCHYELITDNVMDLSHVDHLHGEMISTRGQLSPKIPKVKEHNDAVSVRWEWSQTPPMMIFNDFLPEPGKEARHFVKVTWNKPSVIELIVGATQDPDGELGYNESCISQYDIHACTPETLNSTHYFFATRRNHLEHDAEYNQAKLEGMHNAFVDEDGPLLDAVHIEMGTTDYLSLNPVFISSDAGPVRVRRLLKQLIDQEQEEIYSVRLSMP